MMTSMETSRFGRSVCDGNVSRYCSVNMYAAVPRQRRVCERRGGRGVGRGESLAKEQGYLSRASFTRLSPKSDYLHQLSLAIQDVLACGQTSAPCLSSLVRFEEYRTFGKRKHMLAPR